MQLVVDWSVLNQNEQSKVTPPRHVAGSIARAAESRPIFFRLDCNFTSIALSFLKNLGRQIAMQCLQRTECELYKASLVIKI